LKGDIFKIEEILDEFQQKSYLCYIEFSEKPPFNLGECEVIQ